MKIIWTQDKVNSYWDNMVKGKYFSDTVGDAIINYLKHKIEIGSYALDYGSGNGIFAEKLKKIGVNCDTYDPTVNTTIKREYDTIFCITAIEHFINIEKELQTMRTLLCDGGLIIVITDNNEDLQKQEITCPECETSFHRWQHIHSFTAQTLDSYMIRYFNRIFVKEIFLNKYTNLYTFIKYSIHCLIYKRNPHLIWIGWK